MISSKKKILLYQGGRYFGMDKNHIAFQNILNNYVVDNYDSVEIFSDTDFFAYSTMIFFSQEGEFNETQEKNVLEFISSGKGFIGLHGASASFKNHPKYFEMLGGKFIGHKDLKDFHIKIVEKSHPITQNLKDFTFKDEPYRHEFPSVNKIKILAEADYQDPEDPLPEPMMWIKSYGKGNVFYCALGHRNISLKDKIFQTIIQQGAQWVLNE